MALSKIDTAAIAADAVDTTQIADDAITSALIAANAVDATALSSSAIAAGDLPSGSILQVKQTLLNTRANFATNGTFADVSGLNVTITPSSTSSKIMILVHMGVGQSNQSYAKGRLLRGSTAIANGTGDATGEECTFSLYTSRYAGNYARNQDNASMCFLDSPNTTSATTYKIQAYTSANRTIYINYNNDGAAGRSNTVSTITAMEIAG